MKKSILLTLLTLAAAAQADDAVISKKLQEMTILNIAHPANMFILRIHFTQVSLFI